jgi:hypothetical protein
LAHGWRNCGFVADKIANLYEFLMHPRKDVHRPCSLEMASLTGNNSREIAMTFKFSAKVALAAAGLATFGTAILPSAALAQGRGYDQHYRGSNRDSHRQHYSDQGRGRYASRHCGSGNGAVGTIAGGAGGALLGNALGGGTAGTIVGGVAGALVGRTLDKKNTRDHNARYNGC